jgi:hypothetical protein
MAQSEENGIVTQANVNVFFNSLHNCCAECQTPCKGRTAVVRMAGLVLHECEELFAYLQTNSECNSIYIEIMEQVWRRSNLASEVWEERDTARNEEIEACVRDIVETYLDREKELWSYHIGHDMP